MEVIATSHDVSLTHGGTTIMAALAIPQRPTFKLPKFEPWRLLKPLKMFGHQFYPYQPLQFMDGLLTPVIGAGAPISVTYLGQLPITTGATTYNYGSFTTTATGILLVGFVGRSTSNKTVSSASIAGVSKTLVVNPSGDWNPSTFVYDVYAAGTYAVSCTFSGSMSNSVAFGFLLQNYQNTSPTATLGINQNQGGSSLTGNLASIAAGGIVCAIHMHANTSATTWTGVTSVYDATSTNRYSAAWDDFPTAQTTYAITATWTTANSGALSAVSWV